MNENGIKALLWLAGFLIIFIGISMDTPGDGKANPITIMGGIIMVCPWLVALCRIIWGPIVFLIIIALSFLIYFTQGS